MKDFLLLVVPGRVDYLSLSAILTFPSGSMNGAQQCVCVTILDDDLPEAPEQFILSLTSNSPSVTIINDTATVFINDTCKTLNCPSLG